VRARVAHAVRFTEKARKQKRMKPSAKFRLWSASRPERPEVDPIHVQIVDLMSNDSRTVWQKANESGLSVSTINNWHKGKVKRPNGVSLQMAAAMLGRRIILD
jgi:hypothetical protein